MQGRRGTDPEEDQGGREHDEEEVPESSTRRIQRVEGERVGCHDNVVYLRAK